MPDRYSEYFDRSSSPREGAPTADPVDSRIISRTTWSMLALLLFAFSCISALWVSSWTFTLLPICLIASVGAINVGRGPHSSARRVRRAKLWRRRTLRPVLSQPSSGHFELGGGFLSIQGGWQPSGGTPWLLCLGSWSWLLFSVSCTISHVPLTSLSGAVSLNASSHRHVDQSSRISSLRHRGALSLIVFDSVSSRDHHLSGSLLRTMTGTAFTSSS